MTIIHPKAIREYLIEKGEGVDNNSPQNYQKSTSLRRVKTLTIITPNTIRKSTSLRRVKTLTITHPKAIREYLTEKGDDVDNNSPQNNQKSTSLSRMKTLIIIHPKHNQRVSH